ncbi:MAG: hypothetical protein S4CHLAM123_00920 [Chlamydiales bacterium]|nr:hypothetical protein [Chlamydiales bacterium]
MGRYCYFSRVLPGKTDAVCAHWKNKARPTPEIEAAEEAFWDHLKMTSFNSWLQPTAEGDCIVHCLEGESLQQIFQGLREQISVGNPIALKLHAFYLDVLGKDYRQPEVEPALESLCHLSLSCASPILKRGFFYPLLPHMEQEHRHFCKEVMNTQQAQYRAWMKDLGLVHLSTWLQSTPEGNFLIAYTEKETSAALHGESSQEVIATLLRQADWPQDELYLEVEQLA